MSEEFDRISRGLQRLQDQLTTLAQRKKATPKPGGQVEGFTSLSWDQIQELQYRRDQKPIDDEEVTD